MPLLNPVWTAALNKPDWLMPPLRPDAVKVAIFSLADATRSAEQPGDASKAGDGQKAGGAVAGEAETAAGRLTRALPLYLAEALRLRSDAASLCVIPVIPGVGPIVAGTPWPLPHMLAACPDDFKPDVVVCGALTRGARGPKVELHVFRAKDQTSLKTIRVPAAEDFTGTAVKAEQDLLASLTAVGVAATPAAAAGPLSPPAAVDAYLTCVAHLFLQTLAAGGIIDPARLANDREMMQGYFALAAGEPASPLPTLVAAAGVAAGIRYKSPAAGEFRQPLMELVKAASERHDVVRQAAPAIYQRLGEREAFEQARAACAARGDGGVRGVAVGDGGMRGDGSRRVASARRQEPARGCTRRVTVWSRDSLDAPRFKHDAAFPVTACRLA